MNQTIRLCFAAVLLLITSQLLPAFSSLLEAARSESMEASILELQRRQDQTELSLMDVVQAPALTFDTGSASAGTRIRTDDDDTDNEITTFEISAAPTFTYNLHGEAKTQIEFGIRELMLRDPDGPTVTGWPSWGVTPAVLVTQPLTHFFSDTDALDDLDYSLKYLESELAYRRGMIDIDLEVIALLTDTAGFDRQLAELQYEQRRQQQDHQRSLDAGIYSEGSSRSRAVLRQIESRARTIESVELNREFSADELERLTGMRIDQLPEIPAPDPVIQPSGIGNTPVLMRSLEVDRIAEELAEFRRDHWSLSAYAGYGASFDDANASKPGHGIDVGVSGDWRDLTVSAGIEGRIGQRDTVRGMIEGTWAVFDGNRQQQDLETQQLEYQLQIARQRLELAEAEYRRTNQRLERDLASWKRDMGRHELETDYAQQDLEEAEQALQRGAGTQRSLEEARSSVEQLAYRRIELMLAGWSLQRSIERHLL